ncbi:hypothetical protein AOCH_005432 [Aspergillus ochraceoroseus]|uniref:Vacuolar ATPase assembly protein VMA22 n=1 Tax=Aspergillus ochraceoroseus TaxID=138278 RepID=A0A0F8U817_9EURO|nr:hypothetical protein AOCH_005432 [Aspergillus ochraceoroseus]
MAQLLIPPTSRHSSESPEEELKQLHLADSATNPLQLLDTLLERYLHLLDKHQKLQTKLASKLSSGFLSLAQANYTCPPGRRYGADYYDERMKATRRVGLQPPLSSDETTHSAELGRVLETGIHSRHIFAIEAFTNAEEDEQLEKADQVETSQSDENTTKQDSSKNDAAQSTPNSLELSSSSAVEPETDTTHKTVKKRSGASDPIRWYGILVPPSLRSAQKSFTEAVEGYLPELASVTVEMQAAEKEITRLREELGRQECA